MTTNAGSIDRGKLRRGMRILYHHRTQGSGVEAVHILGIVKSWAASGHYVEVVSPPGVTLGLNGKQCKTEKRANSKWQGLARFIPQAIFECLEIGYNLWAYFRLLKELNQRPYDLLYERYSFLCFAGALAARRHSVPFFLEVNYTSDTPIYRRRSYLMGRLERFIEAAVLRRADGYVVVSTYLKNQLVHKGCSDKRIIVLPNAADPAQFNPDVDKVPLRKDLGLVGNKVVGFVGSFFPWHGIDFFLETFEGVRGAVGSVVYLLVGDGPTYPATLEKVKNRGLQGAVLLPGRVPHEEVNGYLALFDVAVMPHSNEYGSPMKILEYMAMGKAVLAPKLGPIEDIIEDGVSGLLFEPGNQDQFVKRLVLLLQDVELRNRIGAAARKSILGKHNWMRNAEKIIDLLDRVHLSP